MSESLLQAIKSAIEPLATKCRLSVRGEDDDGNYSAVRYANDSTGLKVAVDWSELRPFLTIYRLTNGTFPPDRIEEGAIGLPRSAFDVDDLLLLRPPTNTPVGKMFPRRDVLAAQALLAEYARALEQKAADIFEGDFAVFDRLNSVVAERERTLRKSR